MSSFPLKMDILYYRNLRNYGTFNELEADEESAVTEVAQSAVPHAREEEPAAAAAPIQNHQVKIIKKEDKGEQTPLVQGAHKTNDAKNNKKNEKGG